MEAVGVEFLSPFSVHRPSLDKTLLRIVILILIVDLLAASFLILLQVVLLELILMILLAVLHLVSFLVLLNVLTVCVFLDVLLIFLRVFEGWEGLHVSWSVLNFLDGYWSLSDGLRRNLLNLHLLFHWVLLRLFHCPKLEFWGRWGLRLWNLFNHFDLWGFWDYSCLFYCFLLFNTCHRFVSLFQSSGIRGLNPCLLFLNLFPNRNHFLNSLNFTILLSSYWGSLFNSHLRRSAHRSYTFSFSRLGSMLGSAFQFIFLRCVWFLNFCSNAWSPSSFGKWGTDSANLTVIRISNRAITSASS